MNATDIPQSHTLPLVDHAEFDVHLANSWDFTQGWQQDDVRTMGKDFGYLLMYKANGRFFEGLLEAMREDGFEVRRIQDKA